MKDYCRLTRVVAVTACATLGWAPSAAAQVLEPLSPPVPDARLIAAPVLASTMRSPVGVAVAIGPQAPIGLLTTPFGASYGASRILRRC